MIKQTIASLVFLLVVGTTFAFLPMIPQTTEQHATSSSFSVAATSIVWLTGHEDLRVTNDHGGFMGALEEQKENDNDRLIQPVFFLDPKIHLQSKSPSALKRLHKCLSSLEDDIASLCSSVLVSPLVIQTGSACSLLPQLAQELEADSCHVIDNDVVTSMRTSQQVTCQALIDQGLTVRRWNNALRPSAPWAKTKTAASMPSFYPDYCEIIANQQVPMAKPRKKNNVVGTVAKTTATTTTTTKLSTGTGTSVVPSLPELMEWSQSVTPSAVTDFRLSSQSKSAQSTVEPYEDLITNQFTSEQEVQKALDDYHRVGKDAFGDYLYHYSYDNQSNSNSMYAASVTRLVKECRPRDGLAVREVPTRTFSPALTMGTVSARDVMTSSSRNANNIDSSSNLNPSPWSWGRSSDESLTDVLEWREWFRLLADRSLALQERQGQTAATSGGEKEQSGDAREPGTVQYWRWKEQYLVRYLTWPAGKDYTKGKDDSPAMLLVHGFAASAEQWERLVYSLRKENMEINNNGKDTTPPIYAVDLLGFGHSEKPGLSYTQYLWESQLVDFAVEVMDATPLIMVGNSIGGGLSAGAAASLGTKICQGLVLCNTAGVLVDPDIYEGYDKANDPTIRTWTDAALRGNPYEAPYRPVPLIGNNALDAFGTAIIQLIYPQIEKRLSIIYGHRMANADPAVVYAIQQSAASPGAANVIGSGQKLAPNRPLNEVLFMNDDDEKDNLKVMAVIGLDDQVSSPQVAQNRAKLFSKFNSDTVTVEELEDAGHCPHDEEPDMVAKSIWKWLLAATSSSSTRAISRKEEEKVYNSR